MIHICLWRPSFVLIIELGAVASGIAHEVALHVRGRCMAVIARGDFARVCLTADARWPAVVADTPVVTVVNNDRAVVDVRHPGHVDVGDGPVVVEAVAVPVAADITQSGVTKAVVDASVETDVWPPVSGVPDIKPVDETPVPGSPKRTGVGRQHPGSGYPEEAVYVAAPVSRHPHIPVSRRRWLHVDGQGGRGLRTAVHQRQVRVGGVARVIGGGSRWGRCCIGGSGGRGRRRIGLGCRACASG